ncbi:MAG TPA: metal-dependent hydrolase [Pyrinomonadaceae bacterium]|jgi:inner membrane protein
MDNLTHSLVGLAAAKAGLERTSPCATALCVLAANAPDGDTIVLLLAGRWPYVEHHRGLSHSIVGTLAIAIALALLFYGGEWLYARLVRRRAPRARLRGLLFASLVVSASHPLMDWTNNYGVRPLLPWDGRWFYGDLVFILDPWLWLSIGGAAFLLTARTRTRVAAWTLLAVALTAAILFLPERAGMPYPFASRVLWLVGIVGLVVAHRHGVARRWGASIAVAALALVVVYWGALAVMHRRALTEAEAFAARLADEKGESVLRVAAMPMLADPTRWLCIAETNRAFTRFDLSVGGDDNRDAATRDAERFEKPEGAAAHLVEQAARDERAEIFLGFSRFAATRVRRDCIGATLVQFADLRFGEPGGGGRRNSFALEIPVADADR